MLGFFDRTKTSWFFPTASCKYPTMLVFPDQKLRMFDCKLGISDRMLGIFDQHVWYFRPEVENVRPKTHVNVCVSDSYARHK